jgi:hypothetical protein
MPVAEIATLLKYMDVCVNTETVNSGLKLTVQPVVTKAKTN